MDSKRASHTSSQGGRPCPKNDELGLFPEDTQLQEPGPGGRSYKQHTPPAQAPLYRPPTIQRTCPVFNGQQVPSPSVTSFPCSGGYSARTYAQPSSQYMATAHAKFWKEAGHRFPSRSHSDPRHLGRSGVNNETAHLFSTNYSQHSQQLGYNYPSHSFYTPSNFQFIPAPAMSYDNDSSRYPMQSMHQNATMINASQAQDMAPPQRSFQLQADLATVAQVPQSASATAELLLATAPVYDNHSCDNYGATINDYNKFFDSESRAAGISGEQFQYYMPFEEMGNVSTLPIRSRMQDANDTAGGDASVAVSDTSAVTLCDSNIVSGPSPPETSTPGDGCINPALLENSDSIGPLETTAFNPFAHSGRRHSQARSENKVSAGRVVKRRPSSVADSLVRGNGHGADHQGRIITNRQRAGLFDPRPAHHDRAPKALPTKGSSQNRRPAKPEGFSRCLK